MDGVFLAAAALAGVAWADEARLGVPETEPLAERLRLAELAERDRSKYE